ncbi:MAG: hypothetical protein IJO16_03560 [Clostridia bacterium]|nr:hypothetical protein [Clostridia bacterium]
MKFLRKPAVNTAVISVISAFYAFVFIFTSGHIEFESMLNHSKTLNSTFWNGWSDFIKNGNMKYIGCFYIVTALIIAIISLIHKKEYDEYQAGIFEKGVMIMGTVMLCLFPVALIMILSDANYAVEMLMFLVTAHWTVVLAADLIYVIRWINS